MRLVRLSVLILTGIFLVTSSATAQSTKYRIHVVRVGESLADIARNLDVDVEHLCWLNTISCKDTRSALTVGMVLRTGLRNAPGDTRPPTRSVQPVLRESPPLESVLGEVHESGRVLVFDDRLAGRPTLSGELYDPNQLTISHRTLAFDTVVLLSNPVTGRSTFARVIDRGPFDDRYLLDVSARIANTLEVDPSDPVNIELRVVHRVR